MNVQLENRQFQNATLLITGWLEECVRFPPGDSIWCKDNAKYDVNKGPFIIFNRDGADRRAIYRCLDIRGRHFFSEHADCEPQSGGSLEFLLGYVSTVQTSETARFLQRCLVHTPDFYYHFHTLDHPCPEGSEPEGVMGYVY